MQFPILALTVALASAATGFWALFEKRVVMMSMLGAILWFYAGMNAYQIEIGTQVTLQHETPMLQYIFYFLALLNVLLLMFWLWSEEDQRQDLLQQI
jgi:hypothetical protein